MTVNLRRLHNLYQTISPASFLESEQPLVAVSQLERRRRTPTGEIEWVIGIGAEGAARNQAPAWWSARLGGDDLAKLVTQQLKGTVISIATIVEDIRTRWLEGRLDVKGLEACASGDAERPAVELVVWLRGDVPLSISLSSCRESPLPLLSIMAHLIPTYLSAASSQSTIRSLEPRLMEAQQERSTLAADNAVLRTEILELKRRLREELRAVGVSADGGNRAGKRTRLEVESNSTRTGGDESSTTARSERGLSASLSPQKRGRPGIDYKASMRPGTKGYAGSANRVGRNLDDDWEERESDSP